MIEWYLETRKIKDLKIHPKNPRQLSKEQYKHLKTSIDTFGLIDRPIINIDGTIIGGHQRLEVLKKNKIKEIECWMPNIELSDKQVEELNIRLNRGGSFDYDILANEYDMSDLVEYGFTESEMNICLDNALSEEIESLDEDKPTKKKLKCCPSCGHEF